MKKLAALCCFFAFCAVLSGCSQTASETVQQPNEITVSASETPEPQKAIDEIYQNADTMGLYTGSDTILEDKFYIDPGLLEEYYVKYSNGRFGVADVFILKPKEDQLLQVRELLEQVKLSRVKEFENYDIHNSYQIAQDAEIFEQGDYLVMLMLEDNESARDIIDKYLPKK